MSNQQLSTNTFGCAKWIVSPTASDGTHTTIAAAIASASSGDTIFIRPGTYTENPTLKAGVNLTAYDCDSFTPNVTIIGELTMTFTGSVAISGINLETNSNFLLSCSGSNTGDLYFSDCYLNCLNHTGISCSNANAGIIFNNCRGNLATTGITFFSISGGLVEFEYCDLENSGESSTASTLSGGHLEMNWCIAVFPITTSGTSTLGMRWTVHDTVLTNTTSLTAGGSGPHIVQQGSILSGSASAVSISNTTDLNQVAIYSTNTNCVTGSGTVNYFALLFTGTSSLINTSTQIGGLLQGGVSQAPSAGFIGEQIQSATSVSPSGSAQNITSINLTAGIWDISAVAQLAATSATTLQIGISLNSASFTGTNAGDSNLLGQGAASNISLSIPSFRVTLTSSATYYLVGNGAATGGTPTMYGRISGTRVG